MMAIDPKKLVLTAQQACRRRACKRKSPSSRRVALDRRPRYQACSDVECQALIESCIHESFPEHAILGEEGATPKLDMPYEWIIDPIDGTVNFSHGFPLRSSVAVQYKGKRSQAPSMLLKPMNFFRRYGRACPLQRSCNSSSPTLPSCRCYGAHRYE